MTLPVAREGDVTAQRVEPVRRKEMVDAEGVLVPPVQAKRVPRG
jgi:hypothetical protein